MTAPNVKTASRLDAIKPSITLAVTAKAARLKAAGVDEERKFVGAVGGATVLHDAHAPRRYLFRDAVVEQDHAVRDVFFEPMPGEGSRPALGRDDGRHLADLQPAARAILPARRFPPA